MDEEVVSGREMEREKLGERMTKARRKTGGGEKRGRQLVDIPFATAEMKERKRGLEKTSGQRGEEERRS